MNVRQTVHLRCRICAQSPAKIVHNASISTNPVRHVYNAYNGRVSVTKSSITTVNKIIQHKYIIFQTFFFSHCFRKYIYIAMLLQKKMLITASCTFAFNLMQRTMITSWKRWKESGSGKMKVQACCHKLVMHWDGNTSGKNWL